MTVKKVSREREERYVWLKSCYLILTTSMFVFASSTISHTITTLTDKEASSISALVFIALLFKEKNCFFSKKDFDKNVLKKLNRVGYTGNFSIFCMLKMKKISEKSYLNSWCYSSRTSVFITMVNTVCSAIATFFGHDTFTTAVKFVILTSISWGNQKKVFLNRNLYNVLTSKVFFKNQLDTYKYYKKIFLWL